MVKETEEFVRAMALLNVDTREMVRNFISAHHTDDGPKMVQVFKEIEHNLSMAVEAYSWLNLYLSDVVRHYGKMS